MIEHGDAEICACDVEKSNSILVEEKCELCPEEHVALRVIEPPNRPVYECVPCHGPTAIIKDKKCSCSAPYVLENGVCSLCTDSQLYFESRNGTGQAWGVCYF